jgi:hypothetical protein
MGLTSAEPRPKSLSGRDPNDYARHALHASARSYQETNCYTDVLIELLHACGYEPTALMAHIVRMDFEGDQWTFFKPPPDHIERLYGVDIHEMQPYRPIPVQIAEQLDQGRTLIVELDSWFLPDLNTTSYRHEHVKTSVAADAIDLQAETLHYFHGPGLFALSGEDFRGIFRLGAAPNAEILPPYTELVRFDAGPRLDGAELREASLQTLRESLERRPRDNPASRFGEALERELPTLLSTDLETYHAYAFATVRLAGSGFEALGTYINWLFGERGAPAAESTANFVDACKALSFRLARRREFQPAELLAAMASSWDRTMESLSVLAG